MSKLPLSIIILTDRNNELFKRALKSSQFASEVLIVDNHSGNDWEKLSQDYSFRVVNYEQEIANFAEVRNWALKQADFGWVMFLDSDEELQAEAATQVQEIILSDLYDGVTITRQDIFLGKKLKYGEAGSMQLLRLFKKDLGHFNQAIHEVAKVNGRIGSSEIIIDHYAHKSIGSFLESVGGYAQKVALQQPKDRVALIWQLITYPLSKFAVNYFVKLGFLDGYRGLIYAVVMSIHSLSVRAFTYEQSP